MRIESGKTLTLRVTKITPEVNLPREEVESTRRQGEMYIKQMSWETSVWPDL